MKMTFCKIAFIEVRRHSSNAAAALVALFSLMTGTVAQDSLFHYNHLLAQSDAARRLDEKLESFDPCAKELADINVSGFRLTCRAMTTGGTTLGSVPLVYMLETIQECAAKCRPVNSCVAFSFNNALDAGRHRCEIFGGKVQTIEAKTWVSGSR